MPWRHFMVIPRSGWAAPGLQRGLDWLFSWPSDTAFSVSAVVTSVFPGLRGYPLKSLRSDSRVGIKTQENTPELSSLRTESHVGDAELGAINCWSFEDKHQPETSCLLRAWILHSASFLLFLVKKVIELTYANTSSQKIKHRSLS